MEKVQIGVIGRELSSLHVKKIAFQVGQEIGKAGAVLVCGGMGGVMEEACRGAKMVGGLTLGILPGFKAEEANPWVDIRVITGLSYARNILVVRSSEAIIAIDGSYGTLSEIAYALDLGIPVIGLKTWHIKKYDHLKVPIIRVRTPKDAVRQALSIIKAKRTT